MRVHKRYNSPDNLRLMAQKRENESIKSRKEPKIEELCAEIEKTLLKNFADSKIIHTFALVKTKRQNNA